MARHLRARALSVSVAALLLFQATYTVPIGLAADPSASPVPSASTGPSVTPESSVTPEPSVSPETTPGSSPSVTITPTPPETAPPSVSPSPTKPPVQTPVDQDTGLKPGATEVVGARTATSQTYDNHDGTFTGVFSSGPEFYQPKGSTSWEPISIRFAPGTQVDPLVGTRPVVISDHAPVSVSLFDLTSKDFVTVGQGNRTVGFALPLDIAHGAHPTAPAVNGIAADYADMQPGVDLRVIARAMGSKAFIILHSAPVEPSWTFRVDAPGLTLVAQDDGSINLVDATGAVIGSIPHPYALDSTVDPLSGDGRYTDKASVVIGQDSDGAPTITISVDPAWLATAVYPVYVDPSYDYRSTLNTADAHTASAFPTTNYHAYQMPSSPNYYEMWLGLDPSGTSGTSHDYVRWDVSNIGGVTVDAAKVSTHPWHQYYNSPTVIRSWIARLTSSFVESTINYNNAPSGGSDLTFIDGVEGSTTWSNPASAFDNLVQDWIDGTNPTSGANYGIRIWEDGNGSTYWKRIIASEDGTDVTFRPTLHIDYHTPVTTVYPTGGGPTSDTTVTWTADSSWASASAYHVDVATDAAFASIVWTSGDVTSSADAAAIGATLTQGSTYYWRVKVKNSAAVWTPFSATASFVYDLGNLGDQGQFGLESFDLGAGDQASVNVSTGDLVLSHPIVSLPIRGSSLSLGLTYNSQDPATVGMGPGWRLNVQRRLTINGSGSVTFIDADGGRYTFTSPVTVGTVTTYTRPAALFATLKKDTSQTVEFTLTYRDLSRDTFDILGSEGILIRSEDRHANGVTLAYVAGTNRIDTITDTAGSRTINFAYDGSNRVSSITDWAYLDGSGVVQTTATGSRRATRFFYDGSGNLAGWADPLITAGSCPTGGSHLTCITYGATLAVAKTQTLEATGATTLTTSTRTVTTQVSLVGGEVTAVKDAEQVALSGTATTFTRGASQTAVVRPGTPSSTTTYGYTAATDTYARIQSIWRLLGATNIEHRTIYDSTYPTLVATATDNYGALLSTPARTITTTYVGGSLGLVARTVEPLTSTPTNRQTDFTYDSNNDLVQKIVSQDGSGSLTTTTRYCYDASCTLTPTGLDLLGQIDHYVSAGAQNADTNVTTNFTSDSYGQRLTDTRHNRDGAGSTLDDRVTSFAYDSLGDQISEIVNYTNGTVTNPGDDITPNATTGARTDLTTTYAYDTAGNRVSTTDPRRAIESAKGTSLGSDDYIGRATFDGLGATLTQTLPTTPSSLGGVACSPDPGCRQSSSVYDEFGGARQATTYAPPSGTAMQTGTEYDRDGRATRTFEDTDGSGSAVPAVTSKDVYDAAGRVIDAYDRIQVSSGAAGYTHTVFDGLGRATDVTDAYSSTPSAASVTHSVFDALNRGTQSVVGYGGPAPQTTATTFDLGGRAITTNDGFACQTSVFDYRDAMTSETDGLDGTCATVAGQTRTVTASLDGLGRTYRQEIASGPNTGDRTQDDTFDAVGNRRTTATKTSGVTSTTTFSLNLLDQVLAEARPDGSTAKTNYDPGSNATDRCIWTSGMTVGACLVSGTTPWTNAPATAATTAYDARDQRLSLTLGTTTGTLSTTTYNPAAAYQVSATYLPTGTGKEYQTLYAYDTRQRLSGITDQLCTISSGHSCSSTTAVGSDTYGYDDNDNRTQVNESNGATSGNRYYCYDAANRLIYRNTGAACSSSVNDESNAYDATGNRTQTVTGGTTTNFAYDANGQLCKVSATTCTSPNVTYDSSGRTATYNGWAFLYDAEGRLTSACQSTACTGSGFNRVDNTYDGQGHRTKIVETTSGGVATTTTFVYQGDAISSESVSSGITRSFVTDDMGRIVKMTVTGDSNSNDNATFLVAWNGHGDALGLWRQNADGSVTLANSYAYTTWGAPTTTVASPFSDLAFRYLYVGASDVQSDNSFSLGLLYMHARHYAPALGRFLQPDPARAGGSLYAYAGSNPSTETDPSGLFIGLINPFLERLPFGGRNSITATMIYGYVWTSFYPWWTISFIVVLQRLDLHPPRWHTIDGPHVVTAAGDEVFFLARGYLHQGICRDWYRVVVEIPGSFPPALSLTKDHILTKRLEC